jgi:hypothetical protein
METAPLDIPQRTRLPLDRINHHADEHGIAVKRLKFDRPIDLNRLFTNPSLAPLAHTSVFAELTFEQQRRYNQLVGLMQNELICCFEQEIGGKVLPAVLKSKNGIPPELATALTRFLTEEKQHTVMFRALNRLAQPDWYATTDYYILNLPKPALLLARSISSRPLLLPMVIWMMLLMEERSLMMGRRYAAADPDSIDPTFLETYRAHSEDEVRHVQLDWHMLERLYQGKPAWQRKLNARLLEALMVGVFLKPKRANVRLIDLLLTEYPELLPLRHRLLEAVRSLVHNPGYRRMMYSAEATPISRALFKRLPEFAGLARRLFAE